jgi:hypothetical protein
VKIELSPIVVCSKSVASPWITLKERVTVVSAEIAQSGRKPGTSLGSSVALVMRPARRTLG